MVVKVRELVTVFSKQSVFFHVVYGVYQVDNTIPIRTGGQRPEA